MGKDISLLRRIWNRMFDHLLDGERQRALSMYRIDEQLWNVLNPPETEWGNWAWPMAIYADEGELFAIYTQGGNLFRVDLAVSGDSLTVGDPIQVTEAFPAVQQSRGNFFVRRQADGKYRWVMIAATSVLNRVGELDSSELFQSFIDEATRSSEYPRLDFYHLGGADPAAWEFGTADYLAYDGVCYIASGVFDEHPLAEATIRAAERDEPGEWGASIEFRTIEEAELIVVQVGDENPIELKVPIYRKGKNTRISVLKEQDAAGLFTTLGVSREVYRMRSDILDKLTELYGNEEEARAFVEEFGIEVDRVNQTVKEQGLIHRGKQRAAAEAPITDDDADDSDTETDGEEGDDQAPQQIDLDEEAARAIAGEVIRLDVFQKMHAAINAFPELLETQAAQITALTQALEAKEGEIADLRKRLNAQNKRLQALERDDADKQQQWLEDLPAGQRTQVSWRPRFGDGEGDEDEGADDPLSAENIRKKVLAQPL